ncbi:group I intron-associated PD-(D/E)XK endonuclease [Bacillus cereus group sp. BceL300]|uniref:group I intron-associated PD-(D/E)XK endonuclease n=1 Tax=Bacillus cereus group TaxID=86661 RepID=UPI0014445D9E|nr:group I intron-associated PD-(D/E)XK endonuclease [Bacillus cereus]MDK7480970.1 group I intron-associated PD-(D/E)XK endonuclease [Bacillus cereus]NKW77391.1 hypothetical protein [Bacillus cereus]NKX14808.1 hypothetical protein [Bacillus cereus]HDR8003374.1 hypothetical protein [Bacillus cereus]HDR8014920.1 hypothetical protein [Bacillus cereus]
MNPRINPRSAQTGSISEAAVEWDLLRQGFNVLSPAVVTRYDRVVEVAEKNYVRVQVKTARIDARDGNLRVTYDTPYNPSEVDLIAVYSPSNGQVYYIPIDDIPEGAKGFTLRTTERIYNRKKRAGLTANDYKKFPMEVVK